MPAAPRRDLWDEVWAEYDARRAVHPATARAVSARMPIGVASRATPRPRSVPWLLPVGLAVALAYLVPPVAAALAMAEALRTGGPLPAAAEMRPALEAAMRADLPADREPPAFLLDMKREVAAALAAPAPLSEAMRRRMPAGEAALAGLRPSGWRSWEARYGADQVAVTFTLTDPWRLRWEATAVALPPPRRAFDW